MTPPNPSTPPPEGLHVEQIDLSDPTVSHSRRPRLERPRSLQAAPQSTPAPAERVLAPTDRVPALADRVPAPTSRVPADRVGAETELWVGRNDRTRARPVGPWEVVEPWPPGVLVGNYRVLRRIGSGGMGLVYLAEHQEHGTRCALKTLRFSDDEMLDRFLREAQAQARVGAHGNVAQVLETGRMPNGLPFIAMELLLGGSLESRLKAGPMAVDEVVTALAGICRGLAHLHGRGVIHRDLKPANVLFGAAGAPKLVDFGLALFEGAPQLSASGDVLGTPAYMAPEQAIGDRDAVRSPADMFAVGSILFECLTGQRAFDGASHLKTLELVVQARAPRPLLGWPDSIPRWLRDVCLDLLRKDPAARPTAAEVLDRIEAATARGPLRAKLGWLSIGFLAVTFSLGFTQARPRHPAIRSCRLPAPESNGLPSRSAIR